MRAEATGSAGPELHERARRSAGSPRRYVELLTRSARAGYPPAIEDLAVLQMEGYHDERGRVLVRANPRAAARAFLRVATVPGTSADRSLGYCFDVGLGVRRNSRLAMKWYRRAWRRRDPAAATNIATIYRDRGQLARAVSWWQRAVDAGSLDEAVEVGYCYQYGIGVRRSAPKAMACYRRAIRASAITELEREAAMYHLAILHLDSHPPRPTKAVALLKRAAKDADYPEAMRLLEQLQAGRRPVPCRCRRHRTKTLPGHAACEIHRRRGATQRTQRSRASRYQAAKGATDHEPDPDVVGPARPTV